MGADLSVGDMVDGTLRCAYHYWRFDGGGACVATGSGDPVPRGAQLYRFPTVERYGLIWAFNGNEPLFDLPDMPFPDEDLVLGIEVYPLIDMDPWILLCQAPDVQHHRVVH
ncbi:hypothetical protein GCM10022235_82490 [Kribbella ginsengisoli]|uniref:Rieske domain-containing protein n=2 Tax=Kribbella ginsengisoli TaxID=363865 RepID=A0ABP6Z9V5_9ACTN